MRSYVVKQGDSPGSIAVEFASCPKCSRDLVLHLGNAHKPIVTHPNGYVTFKSLRVGETLRLPDKWFEPRFELLPPCYFASLPYADGVTPSPFGEKAPVILRHFRALDVAADKFNRLADLNNESFVAGANDAADAINLAVEPAAATDRGRATMEALKQAVRRCQMLKMSLDMNATEFPAKARAEVQKALETALTNAQHAMSDFYATIQP
jgi:hypothetical protein